MKEGKEYIVIYPFRDLKDYKQFPNGREYAIGDVYSNKDRIEELSTNKNKLNKVLIKIKEPQKKKEVKKDEKPRKVKKTN